MLLQGWPLSGHMASALPYLSPCHTSVGLQPSTVAFHQMQHEIVLIKVYRCVVMACGCVVMACGCVVENTDLVVYYIKAAYYMGVGSTAGYKTKASFEPT